MDELGSDDPLGGHPERQALLEPDVCQQLHDQVRHRTSHRAEFCSTQSFAVCESLANGVDATKSLDNTKIRDWLASRTAQDPDKTIQGNYHFTSTGLTSDRDVILLQWQDGTLKVIYPNDPKLIPGVAKVQWPMPNW